MYVDISCCVPYRYKFGHILMPWASRWSHSHHLKSFDHSRQARGRGSFFHSQGLGRQVILPLRRRPRKNELHSPLPLRALMLAAGACEIQKL
ncbi:hypothetical protein BS47DRAFT_1354653, partial [Hydnum rufescens UP504]